MNKLTTEEIKKFIIDNSDNAIKKFNNKLIFTKNETYGVKVPILATLAKTLISDYDYYFQNITDSSYEEILLKGLVIALAKIDIKDKAMYLDKYISLIDNWAITDSVCMRIKNSSDFYYSYLSNLIGKGEFYCRFAIVGLMVNFIKNEKCSAVLNLMQTINSNDYYIAMAVAWLISCAIVYNRDLVINMLISKKFNEFITRKAVCKICDSLRIDKETKLNLRAFIKESY